MRKNSARNRAIESALSEGHSNATIAGAFKSHGVTDNVVAGVRNRWLAKLRRVAGRKVERSAKLA